MIHFITPFLRSENFSTIYNILTENFHNSFMWYLVYKPELRINEFIKIHSNYSQVVFCPLDYTTKWGHEQRNYYIDHYAKENNYWCYFLDDDNIPSPDLIDVYHKYQNDQTYDLIVLSQKKGSTNMDRLFAEPGCLSLGRCDIGSFLIRGTLLGMTRLHFIDQRNCDGHLAEDLARRIPENKILYIPNQFTYYNALSEDILR